MIINRIEQLEHKFKFKKDTKSAHNCVHCSFINKQLGSNFSTKQSANKCAWKKFSISFIESIDQGIDEYKAQLGKPLFRNTKHKKYKRQ